MNFIGNLLKVKKFAWLRTLAFVLFFMLPLFFSACTFQPKSKSSSKHSISDEERIWMKEFFTDLLFEDFGAYVLYGTKPMSWSCLENLPTEEEKAEWNAYYESLLPEEKAKFVERRVHDFKGNFQKWEQIKDRLPIRQYLFGLFPNAVSKKVENLLFVNIEQTIRAFLANYEDFRRVLGYDFDPIDAVFDIENRESKFWNEVLKHHALIGILLGFGRDNAWFFDWVMQYEDVPSKQNDFLSSLYSRFYENLDLINATKNRFSLPYFRTYGLYPTDKQLFDQYKRDQKKIQDLYKGRDEVDVALEWLTR
jgi:hypothetical protein